MPLEVPVERGGGGEAAQAPVVQLPFPVGQFVEQAVGAAGPAQFVQDRRDGGQRVVGSPQQCHDLREMQLRAAVDAVSRGRFTVRPQQTAVLPEPEDGRPYARGTGHRADPQAATGGTRRWCRTRPHGSQGVVHRRQFGALPVQPGVAGVQRGQGGGQVVAVDRPQDGAGGRPAVSGGRGASGGQGIGVHRGEDAIAAGGAFDRREQLHVDVVAELLHRNPRRSREVGRAQPVRHAASPSSRPGPARSPRCLTAG